MDDLLYVSVDKLIQIKNEIEQDTKFTKHKNIKKARDALEHFMNSVINKKIINKKDLVDEYFKKVRIYKDKLEENKTYSGSKFRKLLEFIERREFVASGNYFKDILPLEESDTDS